MPLKRSPYACGLVDMCEGRPLFSTFISSSTSAERAPVAVGLAEKRLFLETQELTWEAMRLLVVFSPLVENHQLKVGDCSADQMCSGNLLLPPPGQPGSHRPSTSSTEWRPGWKRTKKAQTCTLSSMVSNRQHRSHLHIIISSILVILECTNIQTAAVTSYQTLRQPA